MPNQAKAELANARASELQEVGRLPEAIKLYKQAVRLSPRWATPLYNLGLLLKYERQWAESLEYNRRATVLDAKNQAAWWNLGIAATALGRWGVARSAWRGFGIDVPPGKGPVDFPCGVGPIRLNPNGDAEVVWARRIDPARAVLESIPFPESNYRWNDVVLNDGAPAGYRTYMGEEVPVFDALDLLSPSPFGTYVAEVELPPKRHGNLVARLAEIARERGARVEDWSTSIRILCRACSEGRPHASHDTEAKPPEKIHVIGIAARSRRRATNILNAWESGDGSIRVESLDDALEPGEPK
jgi:tetratricopeptide (TPR) repeat protein